MRRVKRPCDLRKKSQNLQNLGRDRKRSERLVSSHSERVGWVPWGLPASVRQDRLA